MTQLNAEDADLHEPDGEHREMPGTSTGKVVDRHKRRLSEHLSTHRLVEQLLSRPQKEG